jgi:AcrR family transcriptional regulator
MVGKSNAVRETSRRELRHAATRDEIVNAAWELCREEGLAALSLRALAGRVGLAAPSLYSYFPSKHGIYDAMFREGQEQFAAAMAPFETGRRRGSGRAFARRAARAFFAFCVADPVRFQLLFQRTIPGFEPSAASYALATERLESLGRSFSSIGFDDERDRDLWTAVLTGLASQQLANDPGGRRWARLVDDAVEMLCDRAGLPAGAARPTRSRRTRP